MSEIRVEQMGPDALRRLADRMGRLDVVDVVASVRLAGHAIEVKHAEDRPEANWFYAKDSGRDLSRASV